MVRAFEVSRNTFESRNQINKSVDIPTKNVQEEIKKTGTDTILGGKGSSGGGVSGQRNQSGPQSEEVQFKTKLEDVKDLGQRESLRLQRERIQKERDFVRTTKEPQSEERRQKIKDLTKEIKELRKFEGAKLEVREVKIPVEESKTSRDDIVSRGLELAKTSKGQSGIFLTPQESFTGDFEFVPESQMTSKKSVKGFINFLSSANQRSQIQSSQQIQSDIQTPTSELISQGNFPSLVRKGFFKGGELFFRGTEKVTGRSGKLSQSQLTEGGVLLGGLFLGASTGQFFRTGTAGTLETQVNKNKFELLKKFFSKTEKKLVNAKNLKEQLKILKDLKVKYVKTPQDEQNFNRFVELLRERGLLKENIIPAQTLTLDLQGIPVMRGGGSLTGLASTQNIKQQTKTQTKTNFNDKTSITPNQESLTKTISVLKTNMFQKQLQPQIPKQSQKPLLTTNQMFKQKLNQQERQKQRQKTLLSLATPQLQALRLKQQQRYKFKTKTSQKTKPQRPVPRLPLIPQTFENPTIKALMKLKEKGVDIYVGMKIGKTRKIASGLPPFKAFKLAQEYVDKNIQASFKLVPSKKKPKQKDISPISLNYKFRPSKRNPLYLVESRRYRLDSPNEKRQIQSNKKIMKRLFKFN